ncbi:hypothetical protein GCM10023186_29490 [Hymenobacter koreensis]|uniref:Uncharacterized protein n=1 Tax=Hymenobacter koreensis TaxID=1084523 RepID=A0ABP8J638_9BACT
MRHYVGVLLEHLPPSKLRQLAAVGFEQAGFVQRNGWHRFWNTFGWTHMGTAHRAVVQRETEALIEQVNKRLLGLGELRNRLYGTALLLGDALLPSMQEFDRELVRHLLRRKQQASFGTDWSSGFGGCSGTSESGGAPDFGGGHSGGGGASGDFGDGDSSAGCSGCSGCGGGGCGGD